jgi:hypothetical protein
MDFISQRIDDKLFVDVQVRIFCDEVREFNVEIGF